MTDPRFYTWLWEIENEIRANVPMVYYHVWDNFPAPHFNARYYNSTDEVVCISKVTHQIVQQTAPNVNATYLPHAVNSNIFHKYKDEERLELVKNLRRRMAVESSVKYKNPNKKLFMWNNRNARRKQSGTLIWWFKEWLDKVGHNKATLVMHTDARDPNGQDLPHLIEHLGVSDGQVLLSTQKVPPQDLANMYNSVDFTINISDAEGFGLGTLESLSCGTPIIVNMTGGLQEQVTDGEEWFGIGIEPVSKVIIGSQGVPYIYEDRVCKEDVIAALTKMYKMSPAQRKLLGLKGRQHVVKNYNFGKFKKQWINLIDSIVENRGSWETRKGYVPWEIKEIS